MTRKNLARNALITSILSLVLCVSMLVGTTFAWFTDEVTSAGNKIVAGNLDIELLMDTGNGYEDISNSTAPIFGENGLAQIGSNVDLLWEPGKTQVAYFQIHNNGNLALKYQVDLLVKDIADDNDLYKAMEYAIIPDAQYGTVTSWTDGNAVVAGNQITTKDVALAPGDSHIFALAIHMNEEAGNEYQNGTIDFDLKLLATQDTVESDSFGTQYDKDATYPGYENVNLS